MEKAILEFYPNTLPLLYVVQGQNGGWGKGKTLQEAVKNFKKFNKRIKPLHVNIYTLKPGVESQIGLENIEISWSTITYQSDKVVLLSTTII